MPSESSRGVSDTRPVLRTILFLTPFALFLYHALAHWGYSLDDTFIHLQFARNLASGHGFAFNPGEPVYGASSPLWVFLLAGTYLVTPNLLAATKVFSLLSALLALLVLWRLALSSLRSWWLAVGAVAVLSVNPWFVRWSVSGMESTFAVAILVVAVYLFRKEEGKGPAFSCITHLVFALLFLARPEGALAYIVLVTATLLREPNRSGLKRLGLGLLAFMPLPALWLFYARAHFGTFLPNTVLAKGAYLPMLAGFRSPLATTALFLASSHGVEMLFLGVALLLTPFFIARRPSEALEAVRKHFLPLGWCVGLPAAYILGNAPVVSRYLLMVSPFIILYGLLAMKWLGDRAWRIERTAQLPAGKLTSQLLGALITLMLLQNLILGYMRIYPHMDVVAKNLADGYIPLATFLRDNTPEDTNVACHEIGAFGYLSRRRIVDLGGLITPEAVQALRKGGREGLPVGLTFLREQEADYYVDPHGLVQALIARDTRYNETFQGVFAVQFPGGTSLSNPSTYWRKVYRIHW